MTKPLFEYQEHFSVEDCEMNPDKLYVFGDNIVRRGKGGQAVIRDCDNAVGIATKRLPAMDDNCFFYADDTDYLEEVFLDISNVFETFYVGNYNSIVLPLFGLGTGRANLKETNPKLFNLLNGVFYDGIHQ